MTNLKPTGGANIEEKAMEAGVIEGDALEKVFLRYVYALEPERNLTIYMSESEALAIVHMLSGAVLASIGAAFDSPDEPADGIGPDEPGPPGPKEPSTAHL